jgi:hypothetical protein
MHTLKDLDLLLESLKKEAIENGFKLNVEPAADENLYVIANMKTHKAACIGLTEISGTDIIVSYMISIRKWKWYDAEGFSKEEVVDKRDIRNDIFEFIPADEIIKRLKEK